MNVQTQPRHDLPAPRPHGREKRSKTGLIVAVALALSVAGGYGLVQVYQSDAAPEPSAAAAPVVEQSGLKLATAATDLGTVVTQDGFTLYRFDKDTKGEESACTDKCATNWPPVLVEDGETPAIDGVDAELVDTITREDGTEQVTLNGWPLYRFAKDTAPGETTGEGKDDLWHAIGTDGKPAASAQPAESAEEPATDSGYDY